MKSENVILLVQEYEDAAVALDRAIDEALSRADDLSPIPPATQRFKVAIRTLADDKSLSDDEKEQVRARHLHTVKKYMRVLAAFHEAAHCVVGHLTGLGLLEASLDPTEDSFARASFVPYDDEEDGDRASWARRYAATALAGYCGGLLVAPGEMSRGSIDDEMRAKTELEKAGLDANAEVEKLVPTIWDLLSSARPAVFAVARALLQHTAVHRSKLIAIMIGQLGALYHPLCEKGRGL